jgi:ankyrin repeat protein
VKNQIKQNNDIIFIDNHANFSTMKRKEGDTKGMERRGSRYSPQTGETASATNKGYLFRLADAIAMKGNLEEFTSLLSDASYMSTVVFKATSKAYHSCDLRFEEPKAHTIFHLFCECPIVVGPNRRRDQIMYCKAIDALIGTGFDVNEPENENMETPLHIATENSMRLVVTRLIHHGASVSNLNRYGQSLLHVVAATHCATDEETVFLHEIISDHPNLLFLLETRDSQGRTPLVTSLVSNHSSVWRSFWEMGASWNSLDNNDKSLLILMSERDMDAFFFMHGSLVLDCMEPSTINHPDRFGRTALFYSGLHLARNLLNLESVRAEVNHQDKEGKTAIFFSSTAKISLIMENGGNLTIGGSGHYSQLAHMHSMYEAGEYCRKRDFRRLRFVISNCAIYHDINQEYTKSGWTISHFHCYYGFTHNSLNNLIEKGADFSAKSKNGDTTLSLLLSHDTQDVSKQEMEKLNCIYTVIRAAVGGQQDILQLIGQPPQQRNMLTFH